ncbi:MerR family transcriptional regulator [Photobacterium sagamiensis]|uniref:MerR family transcriptional regulator n=1 Tax=Photobacterium sagamiensis TaxID=2910241 RepID=UPI003D0A01A8
MYRISEFAKQLGVSRTTLLYYEKLGLVKGQRLSNGYRVYSENDIQRLRLLQQLQAGGLTLKECKACLDAKMERQVLMNRLSQLDEEIVKKQRSRQLLAALLGESGLNEWHESIDKVAPNEHLQWLIRQGFTEKEAMRLKWLSKDMNEHDRYMADFERVFETLDRWGPGSEENTSKALTKIPFVPKTLLEVGCGKGIATTVLLEHSQVQITAVDNDEQALARLSERVEEAGFKGRVKTICESMTALPLKPESFDVIWSECSAYIMGVQNAMHQWRSLLREKGVLVISDLVWNTASPSTEALLFWQKEYPDMTTVKSRLKDAKKAGYEVLDHFSMGQAAWRNYYEPLKMRVDELKAEMSESTALKNLLEELQIYEKYQGEFDYQLFVLSKQ